MAGFNANAFRQNLVGGGARANHFEVTLAFPDYLGESSAGAKFTFMCKASQVPGLNVGTIEVPYFGRTIKVPGDRTFEDWTITVINDEDYAVRNAFEKWQDSIAKLDHDTDQVRDGAADGTNGYVATVTIRQLKKTGGVSKQYQLKNAWPTIVEPIELSWENNDQIEEFGVTFAYDYFVTKTEDGETLGGFTS